MKKSNIETIKEWAASDKQAGVSKVLTLKVFKAKKVK